MTNKLKDIIVISTAFVSVFILHVLYFKFAEGACGDIGWFQKYIKEQEYLLGISYALSFAFMAFVAGNPASAMAIGALFLRAECSKD
mgnify:CR=1 FL=1